MSCSLHDLAEYESSSIPSVLVATEEFEAAAQLQSGALGTDPAVVYVAHPIQSRNDTEIAGMADQHLEQMLARLLDDS